MLYFVNDYSAGCHEKVMQRLVETNLEKQAVYGEDIYSVSAKEKIRKACNCPDAQIVFISGGTQTNQLACVFELSSLFMIYTSMQDVYLLPNRCLTDDQRTALRKNFRERLGNNFGSRFK